MKIAILATEQQNQVIWIRVLKVVTSVRQSPVLVLGILVHHIKRSDSVIMAVVKFGLQNSLKAIQTLGAALSMTIATIDLQATTENPSFQHHSSLTPRCVQINSLAVDPTSFQAASATIATTTDASKLDAFSHSFTFVRVSLEEF